MYILTDFRKEDGSYDWAAYTKAKQDNGDECYKCGHFILLGGKGHPERCHDCQRLDTQTEEIVYNKSGIRCPKCLFIVRDNDIWELDNIYEEGEHDIMCSSCDCTYTISTHVSHTWTSPAVLEDSDEEDEQE